jgi:hypothetical protein
VSQSLQETTQGVCAVKEHRKIFAIINNASPPLSWECPSEKGVLVISFPMLCNKAASAGVRNLSHT